MTDRISSLPTETARTPFIGRAHLRAGSPEGGPSDAFVATSDELSATASGGGTLKKVTPNALMSAATVSTGAAAKILDSRGQIKVQWTHQWDYEGSAEIMGEICPGPDGTAYYAASDGTLMAIKNGSASWKVHFTDGDLSSPTVAPDGSVCVTDTNTLHVIKDGKEEWSLKLGGGPLWKPEAGDDGTIYVPSANGKLYAVKDGEKKWVCASTGFFQKRDPFVTSPAVSSDGTVYAGTEKGRVCAMKEGELLWEFQTEGELKHPPVAEANGMIFTATRDGMVYCIKDGKKIWSLKVHDKIDSPLNVAGDGTVFFTGADGQFHFAGGWTRSVTAVKGGKKLWSLKAGEFEHNSSKALTSCGTFFSSDPGSFQGWAGGNAANWERKKDVGYTSGPPTLCGEHLFVPFNTTGFSAYTAKNILEEIAGETTKASGSPAPSVERESEWIVIDGVRLPIKEGMAHLAQLQGAMNKKESDR